MRINFLTTSISKASGGAIYDQNFYRILKDTYPNVALFDDNWFTRKYNKGTGLFSFNNYYRKSIDELLDCDYLVLNSRLYTRMVLINLKRKLLKHPTTRLIVIHHHSNFMNHSGLLRAIHKFFERRIIEAAHELIIPNEFVIDQINKDFRIHKICYLPSAFDKKKFPISPLNSKTLLFVGNIEPRKGLIYGLKAFKRIKNRFPEFKLHIVGKYEEHDRYYRSLKKFIAINGLMESVVFEGRVSDERLEHLYSNADLFLFPSLLEGYGWVMMEAMGHGVPVVAFDNSAMPYTVKNGINGLLITNKSYKEMSRKVIELLFDKSMMLLLQKGALESYKGVPSKESLNQLTKDYLESWSRGND